MVRLNGIQPVNQLFDLECEILEERANAICITDGSTEMHTTAGGHVYERPKRTWLPLSQIEIEPAADGSGSVVTMPVWLAKEKGLV